MALIATLVSPFELTSVEGVLSPIAQRFPVPARAVGFCVNVDTGWTLDEGVTSTVASAVLPENEYLEPTLGQIWPRIG